MKNKTMKGFALIGAILMIFSLLPATALAANHGDNGVGVMDTDRIRLQEHKDENITPELIQEMEMKNNRARSKVQLSKAGYEELRGNFQNAKALQAKGQLNTTEALDAAKEYLTGTIEYMVTRLETIKEDGSYSEDVNATIDTYINRLEAQKDDVAAADTRKDLSETTRDIRKIWSDAQKDLNKMRAQKINSGLVNYLEKTDGVSERLQNEINSLTEEGEDTEELQEMLDDYNALIEEAKQTHESAREAYQNGDEDAGEQLRKSISMTNEANIKLRALIQEMKGFRHGYVTLAGEGLIDAEGNGTIVLSGELEVEFTATNAMIVIKDLAGDAEIDLKGDYEQVNEDRIGDGSYALVYHNFTGEAKIEGSRLTVMVRGEDITIKAEGTGSTSLSGEGFYKIEKDDESTELEWAAPKMSEEDDEDSADEEEDEFEDNGTEEMDDDDLNGDTDEEDSDDNDEEDSSDDNNSTGAV
ncbi:hypothetical protein [Methanococcoides burtonii]|uniref:Uncharacterized protein n=1 Tax=Methanococcoides burtonii (strain DSM 6242 / NBRC 107633 / OCM 468 / ACE-M) TaxID=259564 RepID=Q12X12_METBU|nr:hypothetical protein [Methanococcoides burtonii]ABE52014.1 Hypothetical protein Mbur_1084 [Methanococcoides burtonii DSM 6242]